MAIFDNWRLPALSHVERVKDRDIFRTVQGREGAVYRFPLVDLEGRNRDESYRHFSALLKLASSDEVVRIVLRANETKTWEGREERGAQIGKIGHLEKELLVSVERQADVGGLRNLFKRALGHSAHSRLTDIPYKDFGATPLDPAQLAQLFPDVPRGGIDCRNQQVDHGSELVGILRLVDLGKDAINWHSLASLFDSIPTPFECHVSLKKLTPGHTDLKLRAKLNRDRFHTDSLTGHKLQATEEALRDVALFGEEIFNLEWLLSVTRESETDLRRDLGQAKRLLAPLGKFEIETIGIGSSFVATRFGAPQHVTFSEISPGVLYFLPICTYGESQAKSSGKNYEKGPSSGLLLHRQDGSIHSFDNFNKKYMAFNSLIAGKAGSGKSVFANAFTRSLLNSPEISIIKVDVGGSAARECRLAGGVERNFQLDTPSGIDPFLELDASHEINEVVSVLTEFVAVLVLEESEVIISKSLRAEYEVAVKQFILTSKCGRGFQEFVEANPMLPRANLLARWTTGGVFENAIKVIPGEKSLDSSQERDNRTCEYNRFRYFNFQNIQGAGNRDYSSGVMAAVIASVNLEMIRLTKPAARQAGKRLVFMCDETKFFIDRNAAFFLLTTANFRKFGHSTVLISQNIEDFILQTDAGENRGLLLNSPTRIIFEGQLKEEFLRRELSFDDRAIDTLITNPYRGNDYRQFILQDDIGTRVARLFLTPHEYWAMSSKREDVDKIETLRGAAPWLKEEALIDIMVKGVTCS